MNGFEKQSLDQDAFGDKGLAGLKTFDAFRTSPNTPQTTLETP